MKKLLKKFTSMFATALGIAVLSLSIATVLAATDWTTWLANMVVSDGDSLTASSWNNMVSAISENHDDITTAQSTADNALVLNSSIYSKTTVVNSTFIGTSELTIDTITLPADGTYFIFHNYRVQSTADNSNWLSIRFYKNGILLGRQLVENQVALALAQLAGTSQMVFTGSAGDQIDVKYYASADGYYKTVSDVNGYLDTYLIRLT